MLMQIVSACRSMPALTQILNSLSVESVLDGDNLYGQRHCGTAMDGPWPFRLTC